MENMGGSNTTTAGITIRNGTSIVRVAGRESRVLSYGRKGRLPIT
jgi:hypothetical protein